MNDLEKLEKMLKTHDWYYDFSDDHSVWKKGQTEYLAIQLMMSSLKAAGLEEQSKEMYLKYMPAF